MSSNIFHETKKFGLILNSIQQKDLVLIGLKIVIYLYLKLPLAIGQTTTKMAWRLHTGRFNTERQAGKLKILVLKVFGLTQPRLKTEFIVSEAHAPFTRPLIYNTECNLSTKQESQYFTRYNFYVLYLKKVLVQTI